MSVIVATKEEIQEYYSSDALGQSKLKLLLGDLSSFNKEFDSSAEHFLIGSAVDCILTNSQEAFEEEYYTSKVEKLPSDAVIQIIKMVHQNVLEDYAESLEVILQEDKNAEAGSFTDFAGDLGNWGAYILDACIQTEWQPRWGAEAKEANIIKNGSEYFIDLCKAFGKTVLSQTQSNTINSIVSSLQNNPRTGKYFDRGTLAELSSVEVNYQFPIYFEYRGVNCKALLDIVVVVREEDGSIKSVTPIDLKTMNGNTYYFPNSIKARRYDIQAAWYTLAIIDHFALWNALHKVQAFQFVVESTSYQGKPLVFTVADSLLKIGKEGKKAVSLIDTDLFSENAGQNETLKQEVLGYEQLLDLFIYHSENGFNEEREIQKYGTNPILVDWNGII